MSVVPSPNIWRWPELFEVEEPRAGRHPRAACPWGGRDVLDVGCGDGFHLPLFAERVRSVV